MKNLFARDLGQLLVLVPLAFVAGCQTPIHTDYKPDTSFAAYHTFALMPLPATGPADDPGLILRVGKPAQEAMTAALTAKGFQAVARENADFVVNLVGSSVPKTEVTDWGYNRTTWSRRYGYVPVHVGEVEVRNYEEKNLAIEIFDGKSHELVWVGRRTENSSGKATAEGVKEAVAEVLAKFPPTPGK